MKQTKESNRRNNRQMKQNWQPYNGIVLKAFYAEALDYQTDQFGCDTMQDFHQAYS